MSLAVLAEVGAVVVDDGGGVVIDAFLFHFVNGNDQGDVELARQILHEPDGGAIGNRLGEIVPAGSLFGAEIRSEEVGWAKNHLAKLDENLDKHAWDGEWYLRAFRADGLKFGSKENDEASIFLEPQPWAVY